MKRIVFSSFVRRRLAVPAAVGLVLAACGPVLAFQFYSDPITGTTNCSGCHGDFRGPTSTKGTVFPNGQNHDMHRITTAAPNNMATACNLCHSGTSKFPVEIGVSTGTANNTGIGCTGCHMAFGLRKHHKVNGVTLCGDCHKNDGTPPPETTKPPYYGTPDTRANNPGNTILAANTNENWSIGDFVGLDNDGNNLYDLADYAVGPFKLVSTAREGNDIRVTFQTAGGRTNTVQVATAVNGPYTNLSARIEIPGVGIVTTNYLHVGGATNGARFYRLFDQVP